MSDGENSPEIRSETSPDIPALTSRMARGDESAYHMFFELYFNRLFAYLLVVTGGRDDAAKEAAQLTLLRVVRHVKRFETEEAFWGWLTVLARSSIVDEQRKRNRYVALLDRFFQRVQAETAAPDPEADARLATLLEENLAELPSDERRLIEQKYFADESVRTIAEQTGATEKAVESRLVRVRRKLRAALLAQMKDEKQVAS